MALVDKLANYCRTENSMVREFLAEFLGTLVLVLFGCSSIAQAKLSNGQAGSMFSINWSWGLGLTMGAFIAGNVSGAHLNPAVSLAMFTIKRLNGLNRLLVYMLAQYLGAFIASILVFIVYFQALNNFDGGNRTLDTAAIWASYPQGYLTFGSGFVDQIISTMMLVLCIMAITDQKNYAPVAGLTPLLCGLVVMVIGMTFGLNCGYPLNPARDLSPRLYTAIAGWGSEVFSYQNYMWFLVPILGPHVGALLGAILYLVFIGYHLPNQKDNDLKLNLEDKDGQIEGIDFYKTKMCDTGKMTDLENDEASFIIMKKPKMTSTSHEDFTAAKHRASVRNLRAHQSNHDLHRDKNLKSEQFEQLKASVDALKASIDALKS
jgi:MIP family channel proteins